MPLWDETLEGSLIENVDEAFLQNHLVEFAEKGLAISGSYLLDAHRFTHGIFGTTCLANLSNAHLIVDNNFHLFLTQFMPVHRQGSLWFTGDSKHSGRIA